MKNLRRKKMNVERNFDKLLLSWESVKKATSEFQEILLQSDVVQAAEFWLQKARISFQDRGTISNYYSYIKDLIRLGILSSQDKKKHFQVSELNNFAEEIIDRINEYEDFKVNDRRYRVKALLAFTKFLEEATDGIVKKFSAPPALMQPIDEPLFVNVLSTPLVLTEEEFSRISEAIKSPRHRDSSSLRDFVVMQLVFQTARPLLDVLALQKPHLDLSDNPGVYFTLDTKNFVKIPINVKLKIALEAYLECSQHCRHDDTVFVTREGNPVFRTHYNQLLKQVSIFVDLGFTATVKMIQWSYVAKRVQTEKSPQKIMKELKLKKLPNYLEPGA